MIAFNRQPGRVPRHLKRWSIKTFLLLLAVGSAAFCTEAPAAAGLAARVILLANASDPSSLAVAHHYAAARHVPEANVFALPMSTAETITWSEFIPQIWEPLLSRLVHDRWIDAIPMNLTDPVGRRKYAVNGHRITALVVCRGVPLRIAHDPTLYTETPPLTRHAEFRTNACAVDAELALLSQPNHPINAFVLNPLFQNDHATAFDSSQVVKVSRLDGPSVEDAMALVDRALAAERDGLLGRAYVDLSNRDEIGNGWLEATAAQLNDLGFETDIDRAPAVMPIDARIDAPVLYFGWYSGDVAGVFTLPGFRFAPGAIALHIHSYSAATLHSTTAGWVGPLVARGVTATVGNVYEPYLQLTHRPNLLLRSLVRGSTLVDAAYYSLQALSWQEILVGDPLYRPFGVRLDQQLARLGELPPTLAGYAVLRRVHQLEQANHGVEAVTLLRHTNKTHPSLPVAVALAERLRKTGDVAGAVQALGAGLEPATFTANDWALAHRAAQLAQECGQPKLAVMIWRVLLADLKDEALREEWLPEAANAARLAGDDAQADQWAMPAKVVAPSAATD